MTEIMDNNEMAWSFRYALVRMPQSCRDVVGTRYPLRTLFTKEIAPQDINTEYAHPELPVTLLVLECALLPPSLRIVMSRGLAGAIYM